ncbi:hypothetical protein PWP93_36335 [Paraburkholderia sp. A1RI-2L]|uniref:hypothetical protein n=1 Tax=Paraburkholderia sp. A1RI-2L TaxID=3028367 RepID=UPI003B7BC9BA
MVSDNELYVLIERVRATGAVVNVTYDGDSTARDPRGFIRSVQVAGLRGIGPCAMSPLYAAERLREVLAVGIGSGEDAQVGPVCALFDAAKVGIERHRFSTTQGEFTVSYNGSKIIRYGDDIRMRGGEFVGLSDSDIAGIVERLFKYGCVYNKVEPLHLKAAL